jgi:hypothetical protein
MRHHGKLGPPRPANSHDTVQCRVAPECHARHRNNGLESNRIPGPVGMAGGDVQPQENRLDALDWKSSVCDAPRSVHDLVEGPALLDIEVISMFKVVLEGRDILL